MRSLYQRKIESWRHLRAIPLSFPRRSLCQLTGASWSIGITIDAACTDGKEDGLLISVLIVSSSVGFSTLSLLKCKLTRHWNAKSTVHVKRDTLSKGETEIFGSLSLKHRGMSRLQTCPQDTLANPWTNTIPQVILLILLEIHQSKKFVALQRHLAVDDV